MNNGSRTPVLETSIDRVCDARRVHRYAADLQRPLRIDGARSVLWWIERSQRAVDTLVGDLAIELGAALGLPVIAVLRYDDGPPEHDMRHAVHGLRALDELVASLAERNVATCCVDPMPVDEWAALLADLQPAVVVCDDEASRWGIDLRTRAADLLEVPLVAVDADVIVPRRVFPKQEYAAYTLRPKLHRVLHEFDHELAGAEHASHAPPQQWPGSKTNADAVQWRAPAGSGDHAPPAPLDLARIERELLRIGVPDSAGRLPQRATGTAAAYDALTSFVDERLDGYAARRNQPHLDGTSGLSVFLRFGHVSAHAVLAAVRAADAPREDIDSFVEEFVVRRELAVNFASHAIDGGRTLACAPSWARQTLRDHAADPRNQLFSEEQMLACATHDPLWNAAQRELLTTGTMHGYLRMYWAKQILTWTSTPEEAYDVALRLHDRYALDAREPNSTAGVAWAIAGVHDRAWPERAVFGKVRSMTYKSTSRKFDSAAYIARFS